MAKINFSEDLQQQKDFLLHVIESLTHPFYVIDANDYTILLANSASGLQAHEKKATCYALTHHSEAPCRDQHVCPLEAVKATKQPVVTEHVHYDQEGRQHIYEVHGYPLFDNEGNVVQMIEYSLDITERKAAEAMLREKRVQLEHINQELEQFSMVASHDLQEPLRKIILFANKLRDMCSERLNNREQDYFNRMERAARRMRELISDLLTYSRINKFERPLASTDLKTLINQVLSDLEVRIMESHAHIEIGWLPQVQVDESQIKEVFLNLLSNALKFRKPNVTPHIQILGREVDSVWKEIVVTDNGIGFESEYENKIFEPFYRLHSQSEYEGSGIGLASCRKIIERHGGHITALGQPGQGAEFHILLPESPSLQLPMAGD